MDLNMYREKLSTVRQDGGSVSESDHNYVCYDNIKIVKKERVGIERRSAVPKKGLHITGWAYLLETKSIGHSNLSSVDTKRRGTDQVLHTYDVALKTTNPVTEMFIG